jgi:excisionase family DNA binding protein
MEQVFISIPISDLETRMTAIVEKAVQRALEQKEPVKYYTIREASQRTGKALSTLYTDHCRGKLQGFKSGRHLRFTEDQLVAYLEGR